MKQQKKKKHPELQRKHPYKINNHQSKLLLIRQYEQVYMNYCL